MDLDQKLEILSPAARFDACDTFSQGGRRYAPKKPVWNDSGVTSDNGPDGKARPVFRLLMSSKCEWNCAYCPLRSGNDMPRASMSPEELAQVFLPRAERGAVQGLFLSTGVERDAHAATSRMLDGVELLRTRHAYAGYVHVKLLPGASISEVERAARLADRVSLNLEAPSQARLQRISPERRWDDDLITRLVWARDWQRAGMIKSGLATQFVVGAAGESDVELLSMTERLHKQAGLTRAYFSAFSPVFDTPLENQRAEDPWREHRLYQSSFLLRDYGFELEELPFGADGRLPLGVDPKIAWAQRNLTESPLEVNKADKRDLLRVPGIGPLGVEAILKARRTGTLREIKELKALGVLADRAAPYLLLNGRPAGSQQMRLF